MKNKLTAFERLLTIMNKLRAECPWDKKQTIESLRTLTIEETYELAEAIQSKDMPEIKKELGDILLHIVFYAKIAEEQNQFNIEDVINSLCEKLIYRHPHIFAQAQAEDAAAVERNWEQLKLKEKDGNKTVLGGIPKSLPALIKANRIQDKVRGVGFDWEDKTQIWAKIDEEMDELQHEIQANDKDKMEAEFGDLLFAVINAARLYGVNPENALERTNRKFTQRFNYLESKTIKNGRQLKSMSLDEMNQIWDEAKKLE